MRFLADENCDQRVIAALRLAGYDVVSIRELAAGSDDADVLTRAFAEARVLLTEDGDFGTLVHRDSLDSSGVILFRVPQRGRNWLIQNAAVIVQEYELRYAGKFAVVTPGRLRAAD